MEKKVPVKLVILLVLMFMFIYVSSDALDIGVVPKIDGSASLSKECSRKCESDFCSVPPFLRYGKYCGLLYSGCPGEMPCDGLDACCFNHDACVRSKNHGYLSQECSQRFLNCMKRFKSSRAHSFKGNTCNTDHVINDSSLASWEISSQALAYYLVLFTCVYLRWVFIHVFMSFFKHVIIHVT